MSLWDSMRNLGEKAAGAAKRAGQIGKLKADIMLLDREMKSRKKAFGIELYDHIEPLSTNTSFWDSDDDLTTVVRPHLLVAQREISLLSLRKKKIEEQITMENIHHASRFPKRDTGEETTVSEKLVNAGKQIAHTGQISKYKTEIAMCDNLMKDHKQQFGKAMYLIFVTKEDEENWLPTSRDIRSMYDNARRDVIELDKKKKIKIEDLTALGATYTPSAEEQQQQNQKPSQQQGLSQQQQQNYQYPPSPNSSQRQLSDVPIAAQGGGGVYNQPNNHQPMGTTTTTNSAGPDLINL